MHTANELAAEYGIARAYDDQEALIADVDVDLVVEVMAA
jgi:predicted dehydrogenase